jgi:hypothetical protein
MTATVQSQLFVAFRAFFSLVHLYEPAARLDVFSAAPLTNPAMIGPSPDK